jgi:hypothetical protein
MLFFKLNNNIYLQIILVTFLINSYLPILISPHLLFITLRNNTLIFKIKSVLHLIKKMIKMYIAVILLINQINCLERLIGLSTTFNTI